jgi:hypothetical protein
MNATDNGGSTWGSDPRQWIKVVVYSLLLVNFAGYIADDWQIANHTLRNGGSLLDWAAAFVTSIDELAWFILLLPFELETYALSDQAFTRFRTQLIHGARIICYLFLAHTIYAYAIAATDLIRLPPLVDTDQLCQLAEKEISFGSNLEYTELDNNNCVDLSRDSVFYLIENDSVVTDRAGLTIERQLVWIDLAEATVWLIILLCIEILVRSQERGVIQGPAIRAVKAS